MFECHFILKKMNNRSYIDIQINQRASLFNSRIETNDELTMCLHSDHNEKKKILGMFKEAFSKLVVDENMTTILDKYTSHQLKILEAFERAKCINMNNVDANTLFFLLIPLSILSQMRAWDQDEDDQDQKEIDRFIAEKIHFLYGFWQKMSCGSPFLEFFLGDTDHMCFVLSEDKFKELDRVFCEIAAKDLNSSRKKSHFPVDSIDQNDSSETHSTSIPAHLTSEDDQGHIHHEMFFSNSASHTHHSTHISFSSDTFPSMQEYSISKESLYKNPFYEIHRYLLERSASNRPLDDRAKDFAGALKCVEGNLNGGPLASLLEYCTQTPFEKKGMFARMKKNTYKEKRNKLLGLEEERLIAFYNQYKRHLDELRPTSNVCESAQLSRYLYRLMNADKHPHLTLSI